MEAVIEVSSRRCCEGGYPAPLCSRTERRPHSLHEYRWFRPKDNRVGLPFAAGALIGLFGGAPGVAIAAAIGATTGLSGDAVMAALDATKTVQVETDMDTPASGEGVQFASDTPRDRKDRDTRTATRAPSIIVCIVAVAVVALSVFYLLRPEPLLLQGEADATRLDIAARVDGRIK